MRNLGVWIGSTLVGLALAASSVGQVLISEIRIDDQSSPTSNDPNEYLELRMVPGLQPSGQMLDDLTYVVIGRRPLEDMGGLTYGGAGVIVGLLQFPPGAQMPPTGRYLVREPTMQMPPFGVSAQWTTSLPFEEDATQTHLLVRGFNYDMFGAGYSPVGFDLDIDNDGTLDLTPWQEVVDAVSILSPSGPDWENRAYAVQRAGPAHTGIPAHVFRCQNTLGWRTGRKVYAIRNVQNVSRQGPLKSPFNPANPYHAVITAVPEAGSVVRVLVAIRADVSNPAAAFDVIVGGIHIGTISGIPQCPALTPSIRTMSMNAFHRVRIDNGNSIPVSVIPNASVGTACAGSQCRVTLLYEQADQLTFDTPGTPNQQCGGSCDQPDPFLSPPCCVGDLTGDGWVDAKDLEFYSKLNGFSYKDVNNDGQPGNPTLDRSLVSPPWGPCGPEQVCGLTSAPCLAPHGSRGCAYEPCCFAVCETVGFRECCTVAWDQACVNLALSLPACSACGGMAFDQGCFMAGPGPGCNDPGCCSLVCMSPGFEYCCQVSWDSACAHEARKLCLFCGSQLTSSCFLPSELPSCAEAWCCDRVCALPNLAYCCTTAWDGACVAAARTLCGKCGEPNLQPCTSASFGPGCKNKSCCEKVCNIDPHCCSVIWDAQCVQRAKQLCLDCGSALAGSCCIPHLTPFCDDADCCNAVCVLDPFCCSSQWDGVCVTIAGIACPALICPCGSHPGSCFVAGPRPGCSEKLCCQAICTVDDFCCLVSWDALCAAQASALCSTNGACVPGAGSCSVPHPTPGCDSPPSCCALVCTILPECCSVSWDMMCVNMSFQVCLTCGDPASGSCYIASGSPGCSDPVCCTNVCNADPFCCVIGWDGACVSLAFAICGDPLAVCSSGNDSPNRNCFMASRGRGCTPGNCCTIVCELDAFCCTVEWDAICAQEAFLFCPLASNTDSVGSCFAAKCCNGPGCYTGASCRACGDRGCASAVCAYRPSCCTTLWDAQCADLAFAVCIDREPCPTDGPCNAVNRTTGCKDPSCCNAVCVFDPHCCTTQWDQPCVDKARDLCAPAATWVCPCDGSCFEAKSSPGCRDRSCCAAVCNVEPSCCTLKWDMRCVQLARDLCCGLGLCGDPCNKSCLVVHSEPYCNDSWCCEAVCAVDPFCCANRWDTVCVQIAFQRCQGVCGQPTSGNCFAEHLQPACRDGICCRAVCTIDPSCCIEEWDASCAQLARTLPTCVSQRPKCGEATAGSCCAAHDGPACDVPQCCLAVCGQDPTCCQEEWDELCVNLARTLPACQALCNPACGATCAGSCCEVHPTPRCNHLECCEAVCFGWTDQNGVVYGGDSYCCNVDWDANCVDRAIEYSQILGKGGQVFDGPCRKACPLPRCGEDAGDCCSPHPEPFCIEEGCCLTICQNDPFCCQVSWDANCALAALSLCSSCTMPAACGAPGTGSCFSPNFTPFCSDQQCCQLVCAIDNSCCQVQWDSDCVTLALTTCFFGPLPPANDECAGAIAFDDISAAGPNLRIFSTVGATTSLSPSPAIPCSPGAIVMEADAWWTVQFAQGGIWEISTCNLANFDTAIAVYEHDCNAPVLRACDDNAPFCAQFTSTVTWCAQANQPYLIRIGSPTGGSGNGLVLIRRLSPCP